MIRKLIEFIKNYREERAFKKKLAEMRKRDPFIYK
jgi:hypothetical protein